MWYFYGGWWLIFVIGVLNSLEQIRASSGWKVFKSLKQVQDGFGAESELVAASDFGLKWKMRKIITDNRNVFLRSFEMYVVLLSRSIWYALLLF